MPAIDYLYLTLLWIVYFVIHSTLASLRAKSFITVAFPSVANTYRLIYNVLATVLLVPLVYFIYMVPSPTLWQWSGSLQWIMNLLGLCALAAFLWSLKYYNNMDFLGLSQITRKTSSRIHEFTLSPFHQYVRHPWYFFGLIIIWSRDMNAHFFISAICMTIYFIVGSIYEERKLAIEFGKVYEDYQRAVPGLFPNFRRFLTPAQARELLRKYS